MTPLPPANPEGSSLAPRSRPGLGDLVRDATELDLWAFDELDSSADAKSASRAISGRIPEPRESGKKKPPEAAESFEPRPQAQPSIRVNVSKDRPSPASAPKPLQSKPRSEFDDLDHWDEPAAEVAAVAPGPPTLTIHPSFSSPPQEPAAPEPEEPEPAAASTPEAIDEFSPAPRADSTPVSLVPHLKLSKIERLGLALLVGLLLIGGGVVFFQTILRLPSETERVKAGDFPVKGRHLDILSADTFWRAPIREGAGTETFRRGTQLLPVVTLTAGNRPGAVRLFFRDHDGEVMGDAVNRTLQPGVPLQIAATAGFEDVGMHAAYRTGQSKPWTIEVLEAPSEGALNSEFRKLFEINISTDRR